MDRGAWWATDHGGHKVSDTTEHTYRDFNKTFVSLRLERIDIFAVKHLLRVSYMPGMDLL